MLGQVSHGFPRSHSNSVQHTELKNAKPAPTTTNLSYPTVDLIAKTRSATTRGMPIFVVSAIANLHAANHKAFRTGKAYRYRLAASQIHPRNNWFVPVSRDTLFSPGQNTTAARSTEITKMPARSPFAAIGMPPDLIALEARTTVAARTCLLEGPAFDSDGSLYFSDIIGNRMYRMAPGGSLSVFREDSGRTNGNTFDAHGLLISCEGAEFGPAGRRRVVRTDLKTGNIEVLTDRFDGKRYNSPNDVVVDRKGRIWFTDPFYSEDRSALELPDEAVYRIDPDGTVVRVLTQPQIERPNGLAVTPDDRTLFIIDSHTRPGGNRKVWAFDIAGDGSLSPGAWSLTSAAAAAATACGWTSAGISGSPRGSCFLVTPARLPTCLRAFM